MAAMAAALTQAGETVRVRLCTGPPAAEEGEPVVIFTADRPLPPEVAGQITRATPSGWPWDAWSYFDGCAVCPRCGEFVPCENVIGPIIAAAAGHVCEPGPASGLYLRPPDVEVEGWYYAEADGTHTPAPPRG